MYCRCPSKPGGEKWPPADARRRVGQLSPRLGRGNNGEQRRRPRRRSPQGHGGIAEIRRNPPAGRRFDGLVVQRELSVTAAALWGDFQTPERHSGGGSWWGGRGGGLGG